MLNCYFYHIYILFYIILNGQFEIVVQKHLLSYSIFDELQIGGLSFRHDGEVKET